MALSFGPSRGAEKHSFSDNDDGFFFEKKSNCLFDGGDCSAESNAVSCCGQTVGLGFKFSQNENRTTQVSNCLFKVRHSLFSNGSISP